MKLIRKLVTGLMILLVALGSSPLEVFAYNPITEFPDQTKREWPTQNYNNVATTLPEPPAIANTINMLDMFHYPELIYTGSVSQFPAQTALLANNRSYVTETDSSVAVITRDARWQSGVMWSNQQNKIKLSEPFHMVAYVYLGNRTQHDKNFNGLGGADGITFTMHNDLKQPSDIQAGDRLASGSLGNTGMNAYGALGNGLGVYGSNFSANVSSNNNNMVDFWRGVENGITLEFDTFYNDNNTTQHSDNDLTSFGSTRIIDNESHVNTQYGHIAINILNDFKNNRANRNVEPDKKTNKHKIKLSLGWDGEVSDKTFPYWWKISKWPTPNSKLADGKWHRLEVTWTPNLVTNTGNLNYKIYKQGHEGSRNISQSNDVTYDGTEVISYDVPIGTGDYSLEKVFGVSNLNNTVYWGFSGSTGGFLNNQAVQMLQLPVNYYTAELSKVDQDGNPVSGARFQIEKKNETTGDWEVQKFYNPDPETPGYVDTLETGTQDKEIGVYVGVFQSLGKIKLTQLTEGTYRWKEVAPPEGYQKNQEYYPSDTGFVVNYGNPTVTTEAENKKLYQLELRKTDNDTGLALNDIPFVISKVLDGVTSYLKAKSDNSDFEWTTTESEAKQFETGYSYFVRNGEIVEEDKEDGYIRIGYFESGADFRWKEVSVPAGYDSSAKLEGSFSTPVDNKYLYQATQTNSRLYQVSLEKTASGTEPPAPLRGAVFSLQKKVDQNWETVSQDGVSEFTTNSEGKISIPNLKAGTYRWEEKKAPTGYKRDQQYYPKEEGFEVAYHDGLTIDSSNQNYLFEAIPATNSPRDFELVLEKLSSTFNRPIGEVEFKLYSNFNGTTFSDEITTPETPKTDSEGKIVFGSDLIKADKTYYLVESQTVDGFIQLKGYFTITTSKVDGINVTYVKAGTETDSSPFEFTKKDGDIYSGHLKIYNKRKSILPITGGNGILGYVGIGLTMTIVALLFFIARKRIFKWLIILMVATSGLAGLAGGTQVVSAQEQEQVQLEVNRLVYQPSDTQYKSGVPVAGAKLEVVDVTKSFYELVNRQKLSLKEAQEAVSKSNKIDGQSLAVATTDQSGLVRFTVSKTSQQRPAVYLIRELVTPVAVTKMENMVVVLPILDESGNEKSLISLFPKSHGTFTFDKTIDEKQSSYSFGEPIPYRLSTIIPQDMMNLSSYEIEDIYDQGLRFISDSLEIFIDGEKQSDSIKAVNLSENQFRVVFDVAKLADFGGKKLEVTYQMVIKDEAAIDQDLVNTATLYPGDLTPLVDRENVQTGGFRFIKRAAEGKQNPLAKATFVIKNPTDDTVLTYKEGKYQFEKVATNASGVVRLTSDDDGYFEIRGLRYGEYLVSEIRAPSGYVLNDKPTAFTVGVSTYSQGPVLSIFNVKKPKIRLPETGTVVTSTAFVGLLIMASSLVMIRRRKDN
ncbi:SpaH/EbpB family LPXTG-anchored major pilin [Streptococcus parasuis]|uniref:SpaH/EbpB family LPXTG-anchored major pilin n=1 Tax=Streptococcus parasuis TaxID=1501662 RepID=UPI001C1F3F67|nr:SpaH/EbpB family LPXTG-anchored major pilin [Streptococcus parasuis]QWV86164.1 SpaH/EbpB family LPXTG-anchored major pilin [Streptococcus parasuis]